MDENCNCTDPNCEVCGGTWQDIQNGGGSVSVGQHNGVRYKQQRVCDVMYLEAKEKRWFVYDIDDWPTGDSYTTKREMIEAIDAGRHDDAILAAIKAAEGE